VAIVADTLWAAMQGRKLLNVDWDDAAFEHLDTETITTRMQQDLLRPAASDVFESALKNCTAMTEASYEVPYQSHSCMEPLNCTADVRDDSIEIWGPIQEALWIQADLSDRFGIPKQKVTVNMTFLGGGFGRKAFPDFPFEAAIISKTVKAPVQVVWTREDDMTMGPFRSGGAYRCRGGVDAQGKISAFQVITATQGIGSGQLAGEEPGPVSENKGSIAGLLPDYLHAIPHYSFGWVSTKSPIPILWWRAPIANVDAFAGESFIDELARLTEHDPLQFRKAHMVSPRSRALLERLGAFSHWDTRSDLQRPKDKREGWGVAVTDCFGSMVGQVVKVSRQPDQKVKITKVYAVMDCGWYVNPDIIRAQVEGSIVMAMGASMFHATHFKEGRAVEQNFNTYRMPRISDIPEIEVHIMENDEKPGGVGEPALPAFAPALCNAIFDLTGKRIRTLPFRLEDI
jgi:isoquinoline 1-oxidoreductase beta subunit